MTSTISDQPTQPLQTQSNEPQQNGDQDSTQQDQDGDELSEEYTPRRNCSSDSLLSSPLDPLDEKGVEAAKAFWQPKYDQWDEERAQASGGGDAAQTAGAVEEEGQDEKGAKVEEAGSTFDAAKGEVDPHDEYDDFREPPAKSRFLKLTASPRKTNVGGLDEKKEVAAMKTASEASKTTSRPKMTAQPEPNELTAKDEIISSYAATTSVSHSTIIYTIRHKIARTLLLSRRIHGDADPDNISHELTTFLMDACTVEQEAKDALYAEQNS